jgi:hypothetical protein
MGEIRDNVSLEDGSYSLDYNLESGEMTYMFVKSKDFPIFTYENGKVEFFEGYPQVTESQMEFLASGDKLDEFGFLLREKGGGLEKRFFDLVFDLAEDLEIRGYEPSP